MKVFATVGTQLPFDRFVEALDAWAGICHARGEDVDVFAQIGPTRYRPRHVQASAFLDARACRERTAWADVVVGHAGMGSVLTALDAGKPIVMMPRRAALGEHRNDHQVATAVRLADRPNVFVVETAEALGEAIVRAVQQIPQAVDRSSEQLGLAADVRSDLVRDVQTFLARAGRRPSLRPWKRIRQRQAGEIGFLELPAAGHPDGS